MNKTELNKIANSKKITHCYITKGAYYRPNHSGYTDYRTRAGVYPKAEAIDSAMRCKDLTVIAIDNHEHNKMLIEEIKDLQSRLIF